jgi:hypothetical protein
MPGMFKEIQWTRPLSSESKGFYPCQHSPRRGVQRNMTENIKALVIYRLEQADESLSTI